MKTYESKTKPTTCEIGQLKKSAEMKKKKLNFDCYRYLLSCDIRKLKRKDSEIFLIVLFPVL